MTKVCRLGAGEAAVIVYAPNVSLASLSVGGVAMVLSCACVGVGVAGSRFLSPTTPDSSAASAA